MTLCCSLKSKQQAFGHVCLGHLSIFTVPFLSSGLENINVKSSSLK
ncbi:hypothetical protein PCIT_b1142 [Pseudoalteromonas citrea]|uniref:Uncharacterized protein n=1 Tax=Pseudoalteromonas citrea TaxID=43655 RepID=A0AAD4FQF4_9GAMM|nr:hypothetical protein PCIT_b1142 [Pseudoalteromonas citrea]